MKTLLLLTIALSLNACASKPERGYELPKALAEIYRNGELAPLQQPTGRDLGAPIADEQVSHVCASSPVWNWDGTYLRTIVRCW